MAVPGPGACMSDRLMTHATCSMLGRGEERALATAYLIVTAQQGLRLPVRGAQGGGAVARSHEVVEEHLAVCSARGGGWGPRGEARIAVT